MRLTRLAPALRLCLVLGVLGFAAGCGAESQQPALDKVDEDGMLVARKGIREAQKRQRESARANPGGRKNVRSDVKSRS
jgi:hypothetical protein